MWEHLWLSAAFKQVGLQLWGTMLTAGAGHKGLQMEVVLLSVGPAAALRVLNSAWT